MKRLILILILLTPSALWAQSETLVAIGNGDRYVCILDSEFGNFLGVYSGNGLFEVGFRRHIKRNKRKAKRTNRRLRRAQRRGNQEKVAQFEAKLNSLRDIIQDIKDCRDYVGEYANDAGGDNGDGSDGGNDNTPPPDSGLACTVAGGTSSLVSRIINGNVCSVGNSPVVELELLSNGQNQGGCSGTVVSSRVVITAAHCLEGMTSVRVITGSGTYNSSSISYHPQFNTTNQLEEFDVGVVLTSQDLPTRVSGILSANNFSNGETTVIAGYGLDENGNAGTLRAGTALVSNFASNSIEIVYSGSNSHSNTCNGDSGGPIFVQRGNDWLLAGATSWGVNQNCGPGDNSYFMNITSSSVKSYVNGVVPGLIQ